MRRNAAILSASLIVLVAITGCRFFGKKKTDTDSAAAGVDPYMSAASDSGFGSDPYPVYGSAAPVERTYDPQTRSTSVENGFAGAAESNQHTVVKSDTLYGLARMYYGDQRRWKEIYEANRTTISDPNKIRVGQRLVIP